MKVISLYWFTMKEWELCKCFCAFNTVLSKQKLLQLVLWNKQAPVKEQGYNEFSQINIPFKFSRINHSAVVIMDGYKCCEINTVSLTYGSLQVLPWNNDSIIEKMDGWKWCRHITNFFQYMHTWNEGGIIISFSISILQFLFCKNTVNLKEWVAAITLF